MKKQEFEILSNVEIGYKTYEMVLEGKNLSTSQPGQFINVLIEGSYLRRPISICSQKGDKISIIYKVVGEGTGKLSQKTEGSLDILFPLGQGYKMNLIPKKPLLVGGGLGVPPIYNLAKNLREQGITPEVVLGFSRGRDVFYLEEFTKLGINVHLYTEDGSKGKKGRVVDGITQGAYICACGPDAMLRAVDKLAIDGQYNFEEHMACGFGVCMGCTCQTNFGSKRVCTDGPVFTKKGSCISSDLTERNSSTD